MNESISYVLNRFEPKKAYLEYEALIYLISAILFS